MQPPKLEESAATSETHFNSPYPSPPTTPRATFSATTALLARKFSGNIPSEAIQQSAPPTSSQGIVLTSSKSASPQSIKSSPPNNDPAILYPLEQASSAPTTFIKPSPSKDVPALIVLPKPSSAVAPPISNNSVRRNNCPTIPALSEPLSRPAPNDSASSDHDASSLEDLEFEPPSILKQIIAILRHPIILASSKESRDSKARVTRVFNLIQSLHQGNPKINQELVNKTLTSSEYEQLLLRIAKDKSLQGFFNNTLR
jgi:hypothetical protein